MRDILFQNSIITLKTLNILLAAGFLFGGAFCIRYCERHKMNLIFLTRHFPFLLLAAVVGGRLFYAIENWSLFKEMPISLLYIWDLNFSLFGVLFGLVSILFIITRRQKENFWAWIDVTLLTTISVLFFAHIGFFLSGKFYGSPTELPWGIAFEASHIPYITPLHPTQLYAALLTLILIGYSVKRSRRTHLYGVIGTRALMIYCLYMLAIDFLRGDPTLFMYTKIAYATVAALSFIATVHCSHQTHQINN